MTYYDRRLYVLAGIYFFFCMSLGCIVRFLILFLFSIQFTPMHLGILIAIRPGLSFASRLFWTSVGEIAGGRMVVMCLSLIVSAVCFNGLLLDFVTSSFW